MTVNEYLIILEEELKYYPRKKRKVVLNIYREKFNTDIDLGIEEEKIVSGYPTPYEVAKDIYNSEGINYLDRRKRQSKSNDIFKTIITGLALILTISAALFLTYYIGYSIVRLIKLVCLLKGAKDIVLTLLVVIPFILFLCVVYLYLVDIFILVFEFLLEIFLVPFNKKMKFTEFSVVDFFEEKLNKEKIFRKVLITTFVLLIFFGLVNYFGHSYFYRSFTKATPSNFTCEYEDGLINSYNFKVDEAKISVKDGAAFKIIVYSEFERKINVETISGVTYITTNNLQYFDFLDFLKEPIPEIIIEAPNSSSLFISLENGTLDIKNLNAESGTFKVTQGNLLISDSKFNILEVNTSNAGLSISNLNSTNSNVKLIKGKVNIDTINGDNLTIDNVTSNVKIEKANLKNLSYTTTNGDILVNESTITTSVINLTSCDADFVKLESESLTLKSKSACNVSYSSSNITNLQSITLGGGVVCLSLNANANIDTAGTFLGKDLSGEYKIKCLGNFFELTKSKVSSIEIETNRCEATIEYIKADKFKYISNNSKSVLYFIFGKEMKVHDDKGEILLDNDSSIRDEVALYNEYYQKIEKLDISGQASHRVESGVEFTTVD